MPHWAFVDPCPANDGRGYYCQLTVVSENQIRSWYQPEDRITKDEFVEDFIICNWAWKTDMPEGIYPSDYKNRPL